MEPAPPGIPVGFAAAASAAVPALFPPASLPTAGLGLRDAPDVLSLVDGGVYDNLGLEWFQGWDSGRPPSAEQADFLIVANAGGLLRRATHPYGGLRGLWRAKDVQYSQTTKLRVRWYVGDLLAGRRRGIYLAVELDPRKYLLPDGTPVDPALYDGALPSDLVAPLANLRTDLDRFAPEEADLLTLCVPKTRILPLSRRNPEVVSRRACSGRSGERRSGATSVRRRLRAEAKFSDYRVEVDRVEGESARLSRG